MGRCRARQVAQIGCPPVVWRAQGFSFPQLQHVSVGGVQQRSQIQVPAAVVDTNVVGGAAAAPAVAYPSPAVTARTEWPVVSDRVSDLIGAATAAAGVPLARAAALTERCAVDPVGDRSGLAASGTRFVSRRIRSGATDADGAAAGVADRGVSLPAASRAHDQVSTAVAASADLRLVASVRQCPHGAAVGTPHPMNLGIPFGECGEEPLQPGWPVRATGG